jgi:hypothetical protein
MFLCAQIAMTMAPKALKFLAVCLLCIGMVAGIVVLVEWLAG